MVIHIPCFKYVSYKCFECSERKVMERWRSISNTVALLEDCRKMDGCGRSEQHLAIGEGGNVEQHLRERPEQHWLLLELHEQQSDWPLEQEQIALLLQGQMALLLEQQEEEAARRGRPFFRSSSKERSA